MKKPYLLLRWWLLPLLRARIWTVRGLEHIPTSGGFILAPNHQSWVDSAIVAAAVYRRLSQSLRFVAQSNKYGMFGGLPIENRDRAHVIEIALAYLKSGYPLVIFPEGNSNSLRALRVGKTGVARLALRSGLPVVPVGIRGTGGVHAWAAALWFFSLIRPCHVTIGTPLTFPKTTLTGHDDELLDGTMSTIMHAISELSGKPLPGEGETVEHRGVLWLIVWRLVRPLIQWRVRIRGKRNLPDHGPFIVAANHTSYFDAPALAMATFHVTERQPMFPTKTTVANTFRRLLGRGGLTMLGMLPLNNDDKSKVLEASVEHLKQNGVIAIFPEGTRNKPAINPRWETELLRGRTGAARLVIATRAPLIPTAIVAPQGLGIGQTLLTALMPWKFMRVTYGLPVQFSAIPASLDDSTKEDLHRMTREIMLAIASLTGKNYPHA